MRMLATLLLFTLFAPLQASAQAPASGNPLATINLITFGGGIAEHAL